MKPIPLIILSGCSLLFCACDEKEEPKAQEAATTTGLGEALKEADMPILPVKKGDFWKYSVRLEIPAGATSEGAAEVDLETDKTRTYLGKVEVSGNHPPTDTFEVVVPGQAVERELVEIHEDRVMMRGSAKPQMPDAKPIWLEPAIPFVVAGMRPGQEMRPFTIYEGNSKRGMKVVARETVEVPAGKYPAIRMLMTGNDGSFEVRRTTWFAPGIGIVKEEKTRYAGDNLLFRETAELVETNVKKK